MINRRYIMQRKDCAKFFVKRRPDTGLGDLMTDDPDRAAIYNYPMPMGFRNTSHEWESIPVGVTVTILSQNTE